MNEKLTGINLSVMKYKISSSLVENITCIIYKNMLHQVSCKYRVYLQTIPAQHKRQEYKIHMTFV